MLLTLHETMSVCDSIISLRATMICLHQHGGQKMNSKTSLSQCKQRANEKKNNIKHTKICWCIHAHFGSYTSLTILTLHIRYVIDWMKIDVVTASRKMFVSSAIFHFHILGEKERGRKRQRIFLRNKMKFMSSNQNHTESLACASSSSENWYFLHSWRCH